MVTRQTLLICALLLLLCIVEAKPRQRRPHPLTAGHRILPEKLREGQTSWSAMRERVLRDETHGTRAPQPPIAAKQPHSVSFWGDTFNDDYFYMRNRTADVLDYLQQEEKYAMRVTRDQADLEDEIHQQFLDQIPYWPEELPIPMGDYVYFYNYTGDDYAKWYRYPVGNEAATVEILDENDYVKRAPYFYMGYFAPTADGRYLAFNYDIVGDESYMLVIRDLQALRDIDRINNTFYGVAWSYDASYIFYNTQSELAQGLQVWRHQLGTSPKADVLVHNEEDASFEVHVASTNDGEYVLIDLFGLATTEIRYVSSRTPTANFSVFYPRKTGVSYFVDHKEGAFVVMTNADEAYNFRISEVDETTLAEVKSLWPHSPTALVLRFELYATFMAIHTIEAEQFRIGIIPLAQPVTKWLPLPTTGYYTVYGKWETQVDIYYPYRYWSTNTTTIDFVITSFVSPDTYYTYDTLELVQQMVIPGYNESLYTEERIWVYAPDGMRVPSTYVYRRDAPLDATKPQPIMLSAYGAYGDAYGPTFQSWNLVYLDRGIAYGALWYTEGRVLHKRRTFDDFIATAEYLVKSHRTHPSMMAFYGRSAGGLLMGAVLTQRPDLCAVMWAGVPFVDALNTMSDPTITYVVYEYPEWGNPMANRLYYENMRSYDPYWNVKETAYPNLLVQTGLSDLLVNYWEPTKLVAKLRAMRTNSDETKILLHVVDAGHEGYTGDDGFRDYAFQYGFVISRLLEAKLPPTESPGPPGVSGPATITSTMSTSTTTSTSGTGNEPPAPIPAGAVVLFVIFLFASAACVAVLAWLRNWCNIRERLQPSKQQMLPLPISTPDEDDSYEPNE